MNTKQATDIPRLIAIVAGSCLCLAALFAWHLPSDARTLGADVRLVATPPGELLVKPDGAVLSARNMAPDGEPARGAFTIRNLVGKPLLVRARGLPSSRLLDDDIQVNLQSGDTTLFDGSLGRFRDFAAGPGLRLPAKSTATIDATATLARGSDHYRGQILDITLEFQAKPIGGAR
jgi:hypothetical protein